MFKEMRNNRDVKNILAVLGTAIICAILLSYVFIYYYGPTGHYIAGQTLLDPSTITEINKMEKKTKTSRNIHFVFDRIELTYYDIQKGKFIHREIPFEKYQEFYQLVESEKSLKNVSDTVKELFIKSHPIILTINIKTIEGGNSTAKTFQTVQLISEDYFRVQLHEIEGEWAYFHQSGVYQKSMKLFDQSSEAL